MSYLRLCLSHVSQIDGRPGFFAPYWLNLARQTVDPLFVAAEWEILDESFEVQGDRDLDWAIGLLEIVIEDGGRNDSAMDIAIDTDNMIFSFALTVGWREIQYKDLPAYMKDKAEQIIFPNLQLNLDIKIVDTLPEIIDKAFAAMGFGSLQALVDRFNSNHGTTYVI